METTNLTEPKPKRIYIVVSQTGSIVSKILKLITGAKYNHVSVSLVESLDPMYSFARKYAYNPFWGAFVKERASEGALKRFKNAEINVLEVPVTEEQYRLVRQRLDEMYAEKEKYHYNYRGLFSAYFCKIYRKKNHYYCSEFVRDLLESCGITPKDRFGKIVKPVDFLDMPEGKIVYCGKLTTYSSRPPRKKEPKPTARPNDYGVLAS